MTIRFRDQINVRLLIDAMSFSFLCTQEGHLLKLLLELYLAQVYELF